MNQLLLLADVVAHQVVGALIVSFIRKSSNSRLSFNITLKELRI